MYRRNTIKSFYTISRHENEIPYWNNRFKTSTRLYNTKKSQQFQEYGTNPNNVRLFLILITRREIEFVSNGNRLIEVRVI